MKVRANTESTLFVGTGGDPKVSYNLLSHALGTEH